MHFVSQAGPTTEKSGPEVAPVSPSVPPESGGGKSDERHLWPDWFKLIDKRRPAAIFGEQVASPDGLVWFDDVSSDLERAGYAVGAADLCAAGIGAPHIRQRLYFAAFRLADDDDEGFGLVRRAGLPQDVDASHGHDAHGRGSARGLGSAPGFGRTREREEPTHGLARQANESGRGVGDARGAGSGRHTGAVSCAQGEGSSEWFKSRRLSHESFPSGSTHGFWSEADYLSCRDGRWRPVEPGSFPLAYGAPARVGRLRGYGNALVSEVAATFILAAREAVGW
jgi:DNA (cytosine-5)-methyltransferase 1